VLQSIIGRTIPAGRRLPSELLLRCFDRAGEAATSLSCGHGAEQSDRPLRRSPREYIIFILRGAGVRLEFVSRAPSPPANAAGYDTTGIRAATTKNLALAASIMMLATISRQALADTAAPKAQYCRAATGRSDHQAVRAFNPSRSKRR
jgi:hypothetical protein